MTVLRRLAAARWVAMAAGLATLDAIDEPGFYEQLSARTAGLAEGLSAAADGAGIPLSVEYQGGMFGFVFTDDAPVRRFDQVAAADIDRFKRFFHGMLDQGVYMAPSAYEAGFVSSTHMSDELDQTIEAAKLVLNNIG